MSARSASLTLLGVLSCPLWARQAGGVSADHTITLDVAVTDKSGNPVPGLQQQDLTFLDNKQPQKILSFRAAERAKADPPVEVIVVVDEVNASFRAVSVERQQLRDFLLRNDGQLAWPVSIVFFSDKGAIISDTASRDGKV